MKKFENILYAVVLKNSNQICYSGAGKAIYLMRRHAENYVTKMNKLFPNTEYKIVNLYY